jgi:hypothetical protein
MRCYTNQNMFIQIYVPCVQSFKGSYIIKLWALQKIEDELQYLLSHIALYLILLTYTYIIFLKATVLIIQIGFILPLVTELILYKEFQSQLAEPHIFMKAVNRIL